MKRVTLILPDDAPVKIERSNKDVSYLRRDETVIIEVNDKCDMDLNVTDGKVVWNISSLWRKL